MTAADLEKANRDLRRLVGALVIMSYQRDWPGIRDELAGLPVDFVDGEPVLVSVRHADGTQISENGAAL